MTFEPHALAVTVLRALFDDREYEKVIELAATLLNTTASGDLDPQMEAAYRECLLSFASVSSYNLGRFPESLRYAEQSVLEGRRTVTPSITLARALGNRALAKEALGDLIAAQEDYQAALAIAEELGTDTADAYVQTIRANYALFLNARGQGTEARAMAGLAPSAGANLMADTDSAWVRAIIENHPEESIRQFEATLRRTRSEGDLGKGRRCRE